MPAVPAGIGASGGTLREWLVVLVLFVFLVVLSVAPEAPVVSSCRRSVVPARSVPVSA